jgi:chromosome segregation ATPase
MSARAVKQHPPSPGQTAAPRAEGAAIVQQMLAERRELMIANERLRLELEELRGATTREDPRLHVMELENRALRTELKALQAELSGLQEAIVRTIDEIRKASLQL